VTDAPLQPAPRDRALFEGAEKVARILADRGFQALFAGGCVRDLLLGKEPKDYDVVTDATPDEVTRIFRRTVQVGAAFGVVRVLLGRGQEYEVATFRRDVGYSDGRRPDEVVYTRSAEEDVARRDFTVNALLFDPFRGEVLDHVGGRRDLEARVIRAVGEPEHRFQEDRLRMLRAVRFAARLGFEIEPRTLTAVQREAARIVEVSVERIVSELDGLFLASDPLRGLRLLEESGLFAALFPELAARGEEARARRLAAFGRLAAASRALDDEPARCVAWAILFEGTPPRELEARLRGLKLSRDRQRRIAALVAAAPLLERAPHPAPASLVRLAIGPEGAACAAFQEALLGPEHPAVARLALLHAELAARPLPPLPLVTGQDLMALGLRPGPEFKALLEAVEAEALERRLDSRDAALDFLRRRLAGEG
jgi:poly(A) polymerase